MKTSSNKPAPRAPYEVIESYGGNVWRARFSDYRAAWLYGLNQAAMFPGAMVSLRNHINRRVFSFNKLHNA